MDDVDSWIYLDGPEPSSLRREIAALRDAMNEPAPDKAGMRRRFLARLEAEIAREAAAESGGRDAAPATVAGPVEPTVRSPTPIPAEATVEAGPAVATVERPRKEEKAAPKAAAAPASGHGVAKTREVPVFGRVAGMTAPLGDDAIARAVAKAKQALPFAKPRLALNEMASLLAELAVAPGEAEAIRRRYRVGGEGEMEAEWRSWERAFAARPEVRGQMEAAYGVFVRWLWERMGWR